MRGEFEVTMLAEALQILQAPLSVIEAAADKIISLLAQFGLAKQLKVDRRYLLAQRDKGFLPGCIVVGAGKKTIHAGLSVVLVLQQKIGQSAVGRYHKNPLIQFFGFILFQDDVIADSGIVRHGCATDFLNCMKQKNLPISFSCCV